MAKQTTVLDGMDDVLSAADDGPRSKRVPIIKAAVEHFGEHGYDETKWSAIAERVGIGQTALYHYFESKAHCLLVILRLALERSLARVDDAIAETDSPDAAFEATLAKTFAISDFELLQLRILVNNLGILASRRSSEVEEQEREIARTLIRDVEARWGALLQDGMAQGVFPERDAELLARTLLGTVTGVWRWYRPDGGRPLSEVGAFVTDACRRMVLQ